uniref:XRE family transcriptional regulator n=1 Tax=Muribaculaceae bacterium Z82 TaxID=2304548 RepID=A0A7C9NC26_9BACT
MKRKEAPMARDNLKAARKAAGMTQQQVADRLGVSLRNYQKIEAGTVLGRIEYWDALEDMLGINQRELRRSAQEDSRR